MRVRTKERENRWRGLLEELIITQTESAAGPRLEERKVPVVRERLPPSLVNISLVGVRAGGQEESLHKMGLGEKVGGLDTLDSTYHTLHHPSHPPQLRLYLNQFHRCYANYIDFQKQDSDILRKKLRSSCRWTSSLLSS